MAANSADGTTWIAASPADGDNASVGAQEIRGLRAGVKLRIDKEHVALAATSAGGEHKAGSTKVYVSDAEPTKRPDTTTNLTAADEGRLWIQTLNNYNRLFWRSASAWEAIKLASENLLSTGTIAETGSITLGSLVVKWGVTAWASMGHVEFATPFPTACFVFIPVVVTDIELSQWVARVVSVDAAGAYLSANSAGAQSATAPTDVMWIAIGN